MHHPFTNRRAPARLVAGVLASASLATGVGMTADAGHHSHTHFQGRFTETAAGTTAPLDYDISGFATMVVHRDRTIVKVRVSGLDPTKVYGSHLHNGTCASGGGGHYQDDDSGTGAVTPPNELWLATDDAGLEPNRHGVARGTGSAPWKARTDSPDRTNAKSVVVHEPGSGTRIACADLVARGHRHAHRHGHRH